MTDPDYVGPPSVLDERSLPGVARYIQSKGCKRIFVMVQESVLLPGFQISDRQIQVFTRANLARLKLPYPEAVFDMRFFRRDPLPFYTLAHELAPGRYRPTPTHAFIRLLHEKELLHTCFTQNIDTLERRAGLPNHRIVEAHGSFADQSCIDCKSPFDSDKMKQAMKEKTIPKCDLCNGLVKPNIVFFGEALPPTFFKSIQTLPEADLLIIIGTSLVVHPFASLTELVSETCPRVLINLEPAGDIGERPDDVVILGKCDHVIKQLCKLLQWEEELDTLWEATKDSVELEEDTPEDSPRDLDAEVQKLTEEVEATLKLSAKLRESTEKGVKRDAAETPEDTERVSLEATIDEKEGVDKDVVKPTARTATDRQDAKHDESPRPDTRHLQTQDDGDTRDIDGDDKLGKL